MLMSMRNGLLNSDGLVLHSSLQAPPCHGRERAGRCCILHVPEGDLILGRCDLLEDREALRSLSKCCFCFPASQVCPAVCQASGVGRRAICLSGHEITCQLRADGQRCFLSADFHALTRSLREELDVPDVQTPSIGFLPTLSDVDRDLRTQEDRGDAFNSLVNYAVCGLLESRLRSHEAGLVFDAEERQLLVATASSEAGFSYCRVPIEPSGVTVEHLKDIIQDKAREGLLFVANSPSSLTFEPALGVTLQTEGSAPHMASRSRPADKRLSRNARREIVGRAGDVSGLAQVPGVEIKLEALPDARDKGYWKLVTRRVQEEAKRGWTLRGALRIPNQARVSPEAIDVERAAHTHLVYTKTPGKSFALTASETWREAVEFSPVRAHGAEVDGSLMNKGVFETIRVWASQGWVLQCVFFCELPLGDHGRDEISEIVSGHEMDERTPSVASGSSRSNGSAAFAPLSSGRTSRSFSGKSARLQIKKCKYAMRYHSLLYFARPATTADGGGLHGGDGCIQGL